MRFTLKAARSKCGASVVPGNDKAISLNTEDVVICSSSGNEKSRAKALL
jgi:hypothetical protein